MQTRDSEPSSSGRARRGRGRFASSDGNPSERSGFAAQGAAFLLSARDPLLVLAVLSLLIANMAQHFVRLMDWGAALLATFLFLTVRQAPIARTREKSLTFLPPVCFAVALWIGISPGAVATLAACYLTARFGGPRVRRRRRQIRLEGIRLALSLLLADGAMRAGEAAFHVSVFSVALRNAPFPLASALPLLIVATLGALSFLGSLLLLTLLAEAGAARNRFVSGEMPVYLRNLTLTLALGLLCVVLLTPLAAAWGLAGAFPLGLLLLFAAQTARLSLEARDLRGQIETAEALGRASVTETEEPDAARLLERFLTLAQGLISADRALVWTMDQETGLLSPTAGVPDMGLWAREEATFGEGLIGSAAARMRPLLIPDASRDPRRARREIASGAWLLYPVMVQDRLLGVVQWARPVGSPFSSEDIARLEVLVPQAAVALENARIRQEMHRLAATDGLTGLWNHRKMHELLRVEMRRSTRYHRALSVLMLDVDSFKTFNDTYGHPQGDQLLRNIAVILQAGVRTVDFVGRYGGEEFLVILPETTKDDACRMAERIRSDVEAQAVVTIADKPVRRTVSVGVASYPEDALSPAELVQRADEALYRAKRSGKNCVIWA